MAPPRRGIRFSTIAESGETSSTTRWTSVRTSKITFFPVRTFRSIRPEMIQRTRPDFVLILPWNLRDEIWDTWPMFGSGDGRFIIPIPKRGSRRMRLIAAPVERTHLIELEARADERGFFARTWCAEEFKSPGLNPSIAQCSFSFNTQRGTLRGMHYQAEPYPEARLIRCCSGAIYDVVLDLRPASPTYCKWFAVELTSANRRRFICPKGSRMVFKRWLTIRRFSIRSPKNTIRKCARGVRWDDP